LGRKRKRLWSEEGAQPFGFGYLRERGLLADDGVYELLVVGWGELAVVVEVEAVEGEGERLGRIVVRLGGSL